ncbi:MAG: catechol 2,3-dioxygenase-like lactoylglutathione lyase family enzyme [Alphaproteobacteria bacterium]|jgi:catechol 2,3-dioxygenase-like lactoylglutathione lyase family enzyme
MRRAITPGIRTRRKSNAMSAKPSRNEVDRQVPEGDEIFLDHTAHFVGGLDVAMAALQRLGFSPSGVNLQNNVGVDGVSRPSGTSNRLVRFRRGFLEFLSATHDTPLADQLRLAHDRYEGLHLLAFSHDDLETQHARLIEAGFSMQPMVHMRRRAQKYGVDGEVAWSILRTEPGVMAEGRIQYVLPHTPELTWPGGSTEHPNCADALTGAIVCVADIDEATARYARYLGREAVENRFNLDRGAILFVDPKSAEALSPGLSTPVTPYIAAVSVATSDIKETARVLAANGVACIAQDDGVLWIGPEDGLGAYIAFHKPDRIVF